MEDLDDARRKAVQRLAWLALAVMLWGVAIVAKLISLQVIHHQVYLARERKQQEQQVEIPAPRGTIVDRNGDMLAMSIPSDSVSVDPLRLPDVRTAAAILSQFLDLPYGELHQRLETARGQNRGFLWVKRRITPSESQRLRALHLDWIAFEQESRRLYPNGRVAAHVVGSVFQDEQGSDGIEKGLDKALEGHTGTARLLTDVKRRGIDLLVETPPQAGKPLKLTIDDRIQFIVERALNDAATEHHARTGAAIVMNPYNGEILALANWPAFDPNEKPVTKEQKLAHRNLGLSVPFEPGSIFKVVTISAAMETTSLTPDSPIDCHNGFLALPGRVVHEAHRGFGVMKVSEVLEKSSNIGAIEIGAKVGPERMYEYIQRFGFGSRTGLPLPAESPGLLRKMNRWGTTSLASLSMGQEISTTSVQLARACSVVANGGFLVQPKLVIESGGVKSPDVAPRRVIQGSTAITMRHMMEGVVLRGTGKAAHLSGYTSGGKTGTAQIFDVANHHYTKTYNASFMGFAPVNNPALVIVVTLNGTSGNSGMGASASAPAFHVIATEALRLLDVPKDLPDDPPTALLAKKEAHKSAAEKAEELSDLAITEVADGSTNILEEDETAKPAVIATLQAATSQAAAPAAADHAPILNASMLQGPVVPDLRGKSLRAALEAASGEGFRISAEGSGVVRAQWPAPGEPSRPGQNVKVRLGR